MLRGKIYIFILFSIVFRNNLYPQEIKMMPDDKQAKVDEYNELVKYYKASNDLKMVVNYLNKIAFLYWENGSAYLAVDNFLQMVPFDEQLGNWNDIKIIYSNVGLIYTDLEQFDLAYQYFDKGLQVRRKLGIKTEIGSGLFDVAYTLNLIGDYEKSNKLLDEALEIGLSEKAPRLILNCYNLYAKNFDNIGDLKKAEEFLNKYKSYLKYVEEQNLIQTYQQREEENLGEIKRTKEEKRAKELELQIKQLRFLSAEDSMNQVVKTKQDSLNQTERVSRERQIEIDLLNKDKALKEAQLAEQKTRQRTTNLIIYSGSGFLILLSILAVILFRINRARRKANHELNARNIEVQSKSEELQVAYKQIENQNVNITKSINYAQGIQRALLPRQDLLNTYIPDAFILFKPRDVVSGDFFWFTEIDKRLDLFETKQESIKSKTDGSYQDFEFLPIENHKFAIAAVDCTGHGVPGAFMSMIGFNLLDDIIGKGISRADMILNELHKGVRRILKQDVTENRDGMDMALCVVNKIERTVNFAGAENSLLYIQNGEIIQIKGDRNPIGGLQTERSRKFTGHYIKVDSPSWFYIFSDGFIDQFGGPKGRKFLINNLRDFLFKIHQEPLPVQKEILDDTFKSWLGAQYKQIDDVLVIGFKLG